MNGTNENGRSRVASIGCVFSGMISSVRIFGGQIHKGEFETST